MRPKLIALTLVFSLLMFMLVSSNTGYLYAFEGGNVLPNPPTGLLMENETNPLFVADNTPEFSAIFTDNDLGDFSEYAEVQVGDTIRFKNVLWDSEWVSISSTENGNRSGFSAIGFGQTVENFENVDDWTYETYSHSGSWSADNSWKAEGENSGHLTADGGSFDAGDWVQASKEFDLTDIDSIQIDVRYWTDYHFGNDLRYQILIGDNVVFDTPARHTTGMEWKERLENISTSAYSGVDNLRIRIRSNGNTNTLGVDLKFLVDYLRYPFEKGENYYWRTRFMDNAGNTGAWSTETATFKFNQLPIVENQKADGQVNPDNLTTYTPLLSWDYYDPDENTQKNYHVQVGTSENTSDMWDFENASSDENVTYAGSPLSGGVTYYWRVRVNDGYEWSSWIYDGTFRISAWQLIETWANATVTAPMPAQWNLVETWNGTVKAPVPPVIAWQLIEIWNGTVEATAEWGLPPLTYNVDVGSTVDDNCVLHLNFDENTGGTEKMVYDSSGENNYGDILNFNFDENSGWVAGYRGSALEFDETDDYVNCDNDASLNFGTGDFSLMAWVKTTKTDYQEILIKTEDWTETYELYISSSAAGNVAGIYVYDNLGNNNYAQGTTFISDGNWHHIVGTREGEIIIIYIDGIEENNRTISGLGNLNNQGNLTIGVDIPGNPPSGWNFFEGKIDEVRIYNRALTKNEIKQHYYKDWMKLTDVTPKISWSYYDEDNDVCENIQIQVGTTAGGNDMWDYQENSSVTRIDYAGSSLVEGEVYYLRIRTNDGSEWSDWRDNLAFRLAEWGLIETWSGTVSAPSVWNLIESWKGTVNALTAWQLVETWNATVQASIPWRLVETWSGTIDASIVSDGWKIVPATINIKPSTLFLKSRSKWISCYIELPEGYDVADIDISTVKLDGVSAEKWPAKPRRWWPSAIGDYDRDGIPELRVRFDRRAVLDLVRAKIDAGEYENAEIPEKLLAWLDQLPARSQERMLKLLEKRFARMKLVELTVIGEIDRITFEGSDTIRVIEPGNSNGPKK